ncbi:MAG TPA: hypothetical protein VK464_21010 [Symbiobacteriaceae bacterium]|jgi:hypothetical protein|nr:hypothetical protein [Symbiobacteriaceae bacterium]
MPDNPNLDYEPGPNAASFSRLGPLPLPGAMGPVPAAPLLANTNFELAEEVGVPGAVAAVAAGRQGFAGRQGAPRRSRRRYKYV